MTSAVRKLGAWFLTQSQFFSSTWANQCSCFSSLFTSCALSLMLHSFIVTVLGFFFYCKSIKGLLGYRQNITVCNKMEIILFAKIPEDLRKSRFSLISKEQKWTVLYETHWSETQDYFLRQSLHMETVNLGRARSYE